MLRLRRIIICITKVSVSTLQAPCKLGRANTGIPLIWILGSLKWLCPRRSNHWKSADGLYVPCYSAALNTRAKIDRNRLKTLNRPGNDWIFVIVVGYSNLGMAFMVPLDALERPRRMKWPTYSVWFVNDSQFSCSGSRQRRIIMLIMVEYDRCSRLAYAKIWRYHLNRQRQIETWTLQQNVDCSLHHPWRILKTRGPAGKTKRIMMGCKGGFISIFFGNVDLPISSIGSQRRNYRRISNRIDTLVHAGIGYKS